LKNIKSDSDYYKEIVKKNKKIIKKLKNEIGKNKLNIILSKFE
tara:strand:+ start:552 stop:680 length:129 start_codon:yes stop_codon:yes gene_type:complete